MLENPVTGNLIWRGGYHEHTEMVDTQFRFEDQLCRYYGLTGPSSTPGTFSFPAKIDFRHIYYYTQKEAYYLNSKQARLFEKALAYAFGPSGSLAGDAAKEVGKEVVEEGLGAIAEILGPITSFAFLGFDLAESATARELLGLYNEVSDFRDANGDQGMRATVFYPVTSACDLFGTPIQDVGTLYGGVVFESFDQKIYAIAMVQADTAVRVDETLQAIGGRR